MGRDGVRGKGAKLAQMKNIEMRPDAPTGENPPWCRRFAPLTSFRVMHRRPWKLIATAVLLAAWGSLPGRAASAPEAILNEIAEAYVRFALALGEHDPNYVDAYYGPVEWKAQAKREKKALSALAVEADALSSRLAAIPASDLGHLGRIWQLRRDFLSQQLRAAGGRIEILSGKKMGFDEQARLLYGASFPNHPDAYYQKLTLKVQKLIPGQGPLAERVEKYEDQFIVPRDRIDTVLQAAIAECRKRTRAHIPLPGTESFTLEYVTGKPWSAYNWYQGNARSTIQINTDLPLRMSDVISLAAHEGYPGHHVYNVLLEQELARKRGWVDFSVYPLFSPQSLVAEGSAEYGIDLVLPPRDRLKFEREILFPLAGLDPARAETYETIQRLLKEIRVAINEAARRYVDGKIDRAQFVSWLGEYALVPKSRADHYLKFVEEYGAYIISYEVGCNLVKNHVERHGGRGEGSQRRWDVFREMLSHPPVVSGLRF
jgi:hypothetical protein